MRHNTKRIQQVDLSLVNETDFKCHHTGCIVLTQDQQILLQQRGDDWPSFPGVIATFGGRIETGETPLQTIIHELHEELSAKVNSTDLIKLDVVTEAITNHTELVHLYFWYDMQGTITGCHEGEACYFSNVEEALTHPKIMDDVHWALVECQKRKLI